MDEFLVKVKETHGDNKHAIVYRAAVTVALSQIDVSPCEEVLEKVEQTLE
jgi:hypothetical protein